MVGEGAVSVLSYWHEVRAGAEKGRGGGGILLHRLVEIPLGGGEG